MGSVPTGPDSKIQSPNRLDSSSISHRRRRRMDAENRPSPRRQQADQIDDSDGTTAEQGSNRSSPSRRHRLRPVRWPCESNRGARARAGPSPHDLISPPVRCSRWRPTTLTKRPSRRSGRKAWAECFHWDGDPGFAVLATEDSDANVDQRGIRNWRWLGQALCDVRSSLEYRPGTRETRFDRGDFRSADPPEFPESWPPEFPELPLANV